MNLSINYINNDVFQLVNQWNCGEISYKTGVLFSRSVVPQPFEIVDIYSQNGPPQPGEQEELAQAIQDWHLTKKETSSLVMLDLKGRKKRPYADLEAIQKAEKAYCEAIPKEIDSVFLEGSLKHKILQGCAPSEQGYFVENGLAFCQQAEVYSDAFKLGWSTNELAATDYFWMAPGRQFQPATESTVWYPWLYHKMYAASGPFYQEMGKVFEVWASNHPNPSILSITLGSKV